MVRILILIAVFSLPFTQALTLDTGFPLKIYEVTIVLSCILVLARGKISLAPGARKELRILIVFSILVLMLLFIRTMSPAAGMDASAYANRYGPIGDGITKFMYILLNVCGFVFFSYYAFKDEKRVLTVWLVGAVLAAIYAWYLFVASMLGDTPLSLPGTALSRKSFTYFAFPVIVSGTFREGNFMGLYLLLSLAIALYTHRIKTAIFLSLTILVTHSTSCVLGLIVFWGLVVWKRCFQDRSPHKVFYVFLCVILVGTAGVYLKTSAYVTDVFTKKLFYSAAQGGSEAASRLDRLDMALRGIGMFKDNVLIGVGLSRYGYHYDYYHRPGRFFLKESRYDKPIANNVYIELLSELGLCGFCAFMFFLFSIYRRTRRKGFEYLRYGFIAMLLVFMAYPTFSIMFLWAFLAVVVGIFAKSQALDRLQFQPQMQPS